MTTEAVEQRVRQPDPRTTVDSFVTAMSQAIDLGPDAARNVIYKARNAIFQMQSGRLKPGERVSEKDTQYIKPYGETDFSPENARCYVDKLKGEFEIVMGQNPEAVVPLARTYSSGLRIEI